MNQFLLIAAAVIGIIYFTKANAAHHLKFFIANMGAYMQGSAPVITLQVMIQNPTNEQYTVNALVGSLSTSGGYIIGNVSGFTPVPIAPQSQQLYPVQIRVNLIQAALDIFNLISNGNGMTQVLSFDGSVNVSGVVVPINLDYKLL